MMMDKLKKDILKIREKGCKEGLTKHDYIKVKSLINKLDPIMISSNQDIYDIYIELSTLCSQMYKAGILHDYSLENCLYIYENSILLPLVLANNRYDKIKMYSLNSYKFLCQFHSEKTPSMGVTDFKNLLYCFGCGMSANVISYIEKVESISYKETIELLSQIFLFGEKITNPKLTELVIKYRNILLSEQYKELLYRGMERYKNMGDCNIEEVERIYSSRFDNIERIRNKEYDPNFKYSEPVKILKLK